MKRKRAVVLLSGGVDSTTALAIARERGFACRALSFRYGQRHARELLASRRVARAFRVPHLTVDLDLRAFGGSALTSHAPVPKGRSLARISRGIPSTYVPARNTIFLAVAMAWAETLGATEIWIGVNALDHSGYPDCRPEFLNAFENLARVATKAGVEGHAVRIRAPLIALTKGEIIRRGVHLGVDYSSTHSCYDPDEGGAACGLCDSCQLRLKGFREAGMTDPIPYRHRRDGADG